MLFLICKYIRASFEKEYRSSGKSFQKFFFNMAMLGSSLRAQFTQHEIMLYLDGSLTGLPV